MHTASSTAAGVQRTLISTTPERTFWHSEEIIGLLAYDMLYNFTSVVYVTLL